MINSCSSSKTESVTVDFESLFAGLSLPPRGDGYTTAEIKAATGWSDETTRKRIRAALDAQVCTRGTRYIERIDGRMARVTSYIFDVKGE